MYSGKYASPNFKPLPVAATRVVTCQLIRPGAINDDINSLTTPGASTSLKPQPQYTGSSVLGIGTMHKSNAVPVFSRADARELATMRAGG